MRLTKLHIENFRGIEKFEIDFLDQFTVLIGESGTGKTSVLDAVAYLIDIIGGNFPGATNEQRDIRTQSFQPFNEEDIKVEIFLEYKKQILPLEIRVEAAVEGKTVKWGRVHRNEKIGSLSEAQNGELLIVSSPIESSDNYFLVGNIKTLSEIYHKHDEGVKLPLFAYYGTERLGSLSVNKEVDYLKRGYRLDAYDNALNPSHSNRIFLSWYKTYEDEILKFKKDDTLLRTFKNTITTCIEEWSDITFSFYDDDLKGLLSPENGKPHWILFGMLSDGYRNLIGMVADMAYRCITLNPQLKENAVTETEGVVLIDEVGLHLHPKWQRKVVDDLKRTFPKVQFIATTHSPFVVQSLKASELVNLDRISDVNPSDLTVEEVALNLMGIPNKFSEANAQQEALSKDYLLKVNELQKSNGSAEEILKELDKIEHDISNPAVRAFLQMKRLQQTK